MRKSLRQILYAILVIAVLSNAFVHIKEIEKSNILKRELKRQELTSVIYFQFIKDTLDLQARIIIDSYNKIDVLSRKGDIFKPDFEKLMDGTVTIHNTGNMVAGICIKEDEDFYYILTVHHLIEDKKNKTSDYTNTVPESNMGLAIKLEMIKQFLEEEVLQQSVPQKDIIYTTVQMRNHTMVAGEFLFVNPDLDLGFLRVYKGEGVELEVLKLAETYPKVGDEVYVLGHPLGRKYNFSKGIVSNLDAYPIYIGIDSMMTFGCSGGGVFNNRGEIVGICSRVPVYILKQKK